MRSYKNSASWTPRTYADELNERGGERAMAGLTGDAVRTGPGDTGGRVYIRCACGRKKAAFVMVDVRSLPAEVRGDQEWACDVCWRLWIKTGKISRAEWLRAL